jgi:serine protease Do
VGEADLKERSLQGRLTVSDIWSYPLPENLGLRMVLDDGLTVKSVRADSPAAQIGLQPGDELLALGDQPLVSQADIQWVLHHAPPVTKLPVKFRRDGQVGEKLFDLRDDWKKTDMYWRSSLVGLRHGLHLQKASANERQKLGLGPERMALTVRYSFENAARAGIRNGDIIVSVNGRTDLLSESEVLAYLHLTRPVPREVNLEYSRKGEMGAAVMRLESQANSK